MNADEAIRLIRDGDCICVNSFVGIENPMERDSCTGRRPSGSAVKGWTGYFR